MYFSTLTIASLFTLVKWFGGDARDEVGEAIVEDNFGELTGRMATLSVE